MNTNTPTSLLLVASLAVGGLLAAGPSQGPAPAAKTGPLVCTIDDTHSLALFRVHHMGAGQFWGRFNDVSGNFTFQPGSADGMKFDVTIKTESVDTGVGALDKHLRSPDFFDAEKNPKMTAVHVHNSKRRGSISSPR